MSCINPQHTRAYNTASGETEVPCPQPCPAWSTALEIFYRLSVYGHCRVVKYVLLMYLFMAIGILGREYWYIAGLFRWATEMLVFGFGKRVRDDIF